MKATVGLLRGALRGQPDPPSDYTWDKQLIPGLAQRRGSPLPAPPEGGDHWPLGSLLVEFPRLLAPALGIECVFERAALFTVAEEFLHYFSTISAAFPWGSSIYFQGRIFFVS